MLELKDISYTIARSGEDLPLLTGVSLTVKPGHFMAIVGPSGCGKTTLLKIIAGLQIESAGEIHWRGQDVAEDGDIDPNELGYVPQFSIAYDHLTVEECVENAARLRTRLTGDALFALADQVIDEVGMKSMREKRVAVLSGGQKRRLGLAMEMVSHPALLLCDEVTSGLDPQSEREIIQLLHTLSLHENRTVVNVTHSLSNLELYDSVLVLFEGRVAYHGPPDAAAHYFSVESEEEIYPRLSARTAADWHESWQKHREAYSLRLDRRLEARPAPVLAAAPVDPDTGSGEDPDADTGKARRAASRLPGFLRQFGVLFTRRWTLFFRDRTQCLLQAALIVGFPLLVALFAWNGIGTMPDRGQVPVDYEGMQRQALAVAEQSRLGALISGLVMFQVVLLTLMGSNNSAREIAGERLIYEKERLSGVRPFAYLSSKLAFLAILVIVQSLWMTLFVNYFTHLPGGVMDRFLLLLSVNGAMTLVCLAISSLMKSAEQASLLSIYLVGFQLPLSGAVLAMPGLVEKFVQPFIAAYWSWSGQISTMRASDYFVGVSQAVPTSIVNDPGISLTVLFAHMATGLAAAWIGCSRRQWD